MSGIYLGLGSNLGDRVGHLKRALDRLQEHGVACTALSSLYDAAYVGPARVPQPDFLNCAAQVSTTLEPLDLLAAIRETERLGGRSTAFRWGPRTIDIDLLLYDDVTLNTPRLILPHPRMWGRAFVMAPLAEIAPEIRSPEGVVVGALASDLASGGQVIRRVAGPEEILSGSVGGASLV